ncbi:Zinc transporter 3 [Platanthera guangdongensis]|uniref:Zinc transporter 3 n=1 Tax=Platanthera guangdongensis TaxID=2320717 RepID=A0ABR2MRX3_9ASPA
MRASSSVHLAVLLLLIFPYKIRSLSTCECLPAAKDGSADKSLLLKFIALASILVAGAAGVLIPILGRSIPFLNPDHNLFFAIKSFAAGVILATALIHILPDAFNRLTSPCLPHHPWHAFPFAGFVSMTSAMVTMMVDSFATSYYKRSHLRKARPVDNADFLAGEAGVGSGGHVHAYGVGAGRNSPAEGASLAEKIRQGSFTISSIPLKSDYIYRSPLSTSKLDDL